MLKLKMTGIGLLENLKLNFMSSVLNLLLLATAHWQTA